MNALSACPVLGPAPPQSPTAQPGIDGGDDMVRGDQESSTKQKGDEQSETEGSHLEVVLGEDAHAGGPPTRPVLERRRGKGDLVVGRGKGVLVVAGAREQGGAGCSASAVSNVEVEDRSDCACVWPGASKTPCCLIYTRWTCSPHTSQTPNRLGAGAASQALAYDVNH